MGGGGISLTGDKTVEPVEILTFLGIEIDTVIAELRLPKISSPRSN